MITRKMHYASRNVLLFFLPFIALASCVENTQVDAAGDVPLLDTLVLPTPPQLSFVEVIPRELTDSAKTEIITRLVTKINEDSTLTLVQVPDSVNGLLSGHFRNDSLVMLHLGYGLGQSMKDRTTMRSGSTKRYYFHSDSLIFSEYHCSSWQQTGRCSPVSFSVWSWFYEREVISQEMDENIGPYGGCGCGFGFGRELYTYTAQLDELLAIVKLAKHDASMLREEGK